MYCICHAAIKISGLLPSTGLKQAIYKSWFATFLCCLTGGRGRGRPERGRGRRGRGRYDDDDEGGGGMTLEEWEAKQKAKGPITLSGVLKRCNGVSPV